MKRIESGPPTHGCTLMSILPSPSRATAPFSSPIASFRILLEHACRSVTSSTPSLRLPARAADGAAAAAPGASAAAAAEVGLSCTSASASVLGRFAGRSSSLVGGGWGAAAESPMRPSFSQLDFSAASQSPSAKFWHAAGSAGAGGQPDAASYM